MEEFILKDKIKEGDKFIFLDFDGVITTPKSKWQLILTTLWRNKCS